MRKSANLRDSVSGSNPVTPTYRKSRKIVFSTIERAKRVMYYVIL